MGKKITKEDLLELSEASVVGGTHVTPNPETEKLLNMIEQLTSTVDDLREGFIELEARVNELYLNESEQVVSKIVQGNAVPTKPLHSVRVVKNPATFLFVLERLFDRH